MGSTAVCNKKNKKAKAITVKIISCDLGGIKKESLASQALKIGNFAFDQKGRFVPRIYKGDKEPTYLNS